jgi:hypothetical protein
MTIEEIRKFYDAQPFQPFVLHVADGREIPVIGREFMASAPKGRMISVYQPDGASDHLDLLLVTGIEVRPTTNGARRRKR